MIIANTSWTQVIVHRTSSETLVSIVLKFFQAFEQSYPPKSEVRSQKICSVIAQYDQSTKNEILAQDVLSQLEEVIYKTPCIGLGVDESTDVSDNTQLLVYARFFNNDKEFFLLLQYLSVHVCAHVYAFSFLLLVLGLADRFEEYPKLRELIRLKDELIASTNTPPMQADLDAFDLRDLKCKFDVILLEPPLEEYYRESGIIASERFWTWDDIMKLEIEEISDLRSFVFLWCGSGEGLDLGRMCLRKWGFRRCEDICWIKTNKNNPGKTKTLDPKAVFQRTKEHCLMGIKGTVRRSTDGDFIHANVDIDLIITEEPEIGNIEKPVEIFHIIEHFCLGRRRLHLFGRDSTIRPGWLTVGPTLTNSNFNAEAYEEFFLLSPLSGCTEDIERLRPKSPPPKLKTERGGGAQRGGRGGATAVRGDRGRERNRPNFRGDRGGFRGRGGPHRGFPPR
ncbi:hypothetical protein ACEWY4_022632 [Coilia grayii]|uniref:N(6)-adenosine-methyltransferase non-catalytic subunit METTL14 n=1 Tax=Coilia grayii TaxID=363190 RepID=A0ABD1J6W9_9TELE